jgi:recombination protein RecR
MPVRISPLIDRLIDALRILPGVGPKSAQRMALHLLRHNRDGARALADALRVAVDKVGYCGRCRTFSETELCVLCADERRDPALVCVVESAADILAIEQAGGYRGRYFVLHGRLSPLDGIGPDALGLDRLEALARSKGVEEVILATNTTVEGEATAHFISEILRGSGVRVTRIALGVPVGGELEFADGGTIVHALRGRRSIGPDGVGPP